MSQKVVGICLDGVIRNTFDQFDSTYRKKFIKNPELVPISENFDVLPDEENEAEENRISAIVNQKIHLPMSTYDLRNHYEFDNVSEFHKFLYEDCVLQVFGFAGQYPFAMETANRLSNMGEALDLYSTILICSGQHQAITATYRFLYSNGCKIPHIDFLNTPEKIWEKCDVIITDNPHIIQAKPENKKVVKISALYNENMICDMELKNLKSISDNEFKNLFTNTSDNN